MKKSLVKSFTPLLILLLITSIAVFPTTTFADQTNQEKAMDFMEKMLPIELSEYTINLKFDSTLSDIPLPSGYEKKGDDLLYHLNSENSKVYVSLEIVKGIISYCNIQEVEGQAITNKQYDSMYDAVTSFLEAYQAYTKIDSTNLATMLNNIDLTKNSTITTENTKLTIKSQIFGQDHLTNFRWEHTINDTPYNYLDLTFDSVTYLFLSVLDTRAIYTIGDTSINISVDQAIDIALEGLKSYSYEMPDGSTVKDFKVSRNNVEAALKVDLFGYEYRPYWHVGIFFDDVAPGNVFGVTVFLWANTGEIISISNMATGGIDNYPNNSNNGSTGESTDGDKSSSTFLEKPLVFVFAAIIVTIVMVVAIGLVAKKRRK